MAAAWETRFSEFVARLAALRESTALELLPDLMPVLPVIDPASPAVQRLRGEKLIGAGRDITAAAAQFATVYFGVPAGANVLLTILRFWVMSIVTQEVSFIVGQSEPAGASGMISDDRRETSATIISRAGSVSEPASFGGQRRIIVPANTTAFVEYPMVLDAGDYVSVQALTANTRLVVTAFGYERTVLPQETR